MNKEELIATYEERLVEADMEEFRSIIFSTMISFMRHRVAQGDSIPVCLHKATNNIITTTIEYLQQHGAVIPPSILQSIGQSDAKHS